MTEYDTTDHHTTEHGTSPAPPAAPATERAVRQRLRRLGLTLTASDPTARADLDTARHHLAATLGHALPGAMPGAMPGATPGAMPGAAASTATSTAAGSVALARYALAALALGDIDAAPLVARLLAPLLDEHPALAPYFILLHTRHLAWTGSIHLMRDEWPRTLELLGRRTAHPPSPGEMDRPGAATWWAALEELALAAESIGEKAAAERLRDEARLEASARVDHDLAAPGEPGLAIDADAADVVDYYLRTVLGAEPDAPQNRLVLRPRFPEGWTTATVERLRFGDAELTLRYRRQGTLHHFTFTQESGAVPVRVIFEPLLPIPTLAGATVDGQPALLEPRPHAGRLLVPIQIVLDDERVLELEGGAKPERTRIPLPVR
jgi:hypothetical protein